MGDAVNKKQFKGKELKQAKRVRQARGKKIREVFDSAFFHTSPNIFTFCAAFALTLSFLFTFSSLPAAAADEKAYVVHEYRYVPATAADDRETGLSLCGTRCNALSTDYRNISEPMGWQMIRVATGQELIVELNSRFIGGHCVCVVDEYMVKIDDRSTRENRRPRAQEGPEATKPKKY